MGRTLKILFSVIVGVILLLLVAVFTLPLFVDPNEYKDDIQNAVKDNIGRELTISGDLELSVFPWIGIETGELVLSNAPGFAEQTFASISESQIKLKILPLFSKKVEISKIVLKGIDLSLAKNSEGVSNWDDLVSSEKPEEVEKKPEDTAEPDKSNTLLAALTIGGIDIENTRIVWDDQQSGQHVEVKDFNFALDKFEFDQPVNVEFSFNVLNKEPQISESITFSADVSVNKLMDQISVKGMKLFSSTEGKTIPGQKLDVNLDSNIDVNLTSQTLAVSDLKVASGTMVLESDINAENFLDALALQGNVKLHSDNLGLFLKSLELPFAQYKQNESIKDFALNFQLSATKNSAVIKNLNLAADDLKVQGSVNVKDFADLAVDTQVKVTPFNLAQLLAKLAIELPEMKDPAAMSNVGLDLALVAGKNSVNVKSLDLMLDDSRLKGTASVTNFKKPAVRFNLNLDKIQTSRYLPPAKEKTENEPKKTATPAAAAVAGASLFPVETLRGLDVDGGLTIGDLEFNQLTMQGLALKINAKKGLIKTQQSVKKFYQGAYSGKTSLNVKNKTPVLSLNEKLTNVQVKQLFQDMQLKESLMGLDMTGVTNASANIQGRGNSVPAIKSSLNGQLQFSFKESTIKGFNLQKIIDAGESLINGKPMPANHKSDQTVFSTIQASAQINRGVLTNNDLLAESSKVKVNGQGTINLANDKLDYQIGARLFKKAATDTKAARIRGIPIIYDIGGTTKEPTFQLDIAAMAAEKYQAKINKEKDKLIKKLDDKVLKKLDEKIGPGVGNLLKGLF